MNPKPVQLRVVDRTDASKRPGKDPGSDNECSIYLPNRIRNRFWRGLESVSSEKRERIVARFWSKVNKTEGCWLWTGSTDVYGYGQLSLRLDGHSGILKAHRLGWELAYGLIPVNLQINHRCDVPACVRPEHLFLGSQDDNLKDAARKGRFHTSRTRTLDLADRLAIYHMPNRRGICVELALRYGVSQAAISLIRRGRFVGSPRAPFGCSLQQQFQMSGLFERVPHVQLPVRGEVA